jgi:hypothetical protein
MSPSPSIWVRLPAAVAHHLARDHDRDRDRDRDPGADDSDRRRDPATSGFGDPSG